MRLIDADKVETTAVLALKLQHANSRYYYFYEEETIEKAPTVKAIPIEFIEEYIEYQDTEEKKVLRMMWHAWELLEKENESRSTESIE